MVLLIDANVAIDYLLRREGFCESAREIIALCAKERMKGCLAFHSVSIIWYAMRKLEDSIRRANLKLLCTILEIVSVSNPEVEYAIDKTVFKDFEDCLQDECAASVHADYIITRNVKDFTYSRVKAITPEDFLKLYG